MDYDTIVNNYAPLGEDLTGTLSGIIYGTGDTFWISPAGEVFVYDDDECWEYQRENDNLFAPVWTRKPTGYHAKLKAKVFSDSFIVQPAQCDTPKVRLDMVDGKVIRFEPTN